jgi:MoxR-like ATPase
MDRFLMHVMVDYPAPHTEQLILALSRQETLKTASATIAKIDQATLFTARQQVLQVHMSEPVEAYLVQIILATRNSSGYGGDLADWLDYGASPRATIALDRCSRALAWLDNRDYVTPDDVRSVAHDILRHRLILSFEAEAAGVSANRVIDLLLRTVPSA